MSRRITAASQEISQMNPNSDEILDISANWERQPSLRLEVVDSLDGFFLPGDYWEFSGATCVSTSVGEGWESEDGISAARIGRMEKDTKNPELKINQIFFENGEEASKSVSKEHAVLIFDDEKFFLVDLGSSNHTWVEVNDEGVLRPGMFLDLGGDQLYVSNCGNEDEELSNFESLDVLDPYCLIVDGQFRLRDDLIDNKEGLQLENIMTADQYSLTEKDKSYLIGRAKNAEVKLEGESSS